MTTLPLKPLRLLHLLISAALFCGLFALSYPYYRYYIDPDAVAYLTMAKRAATGEPMRLVNALWSPLHPAMVAVCIKGGMDAVLAAQLTNGLACLLVLTGTYALLRRNRISAGTGLPLLLSLSCFLTYALYKQLFCDLWQVGLLLAYLLLVTSSRFLKKPGLWLLCGLIMALAAYAKVYSFYFLLLHLPVALWLKSRAEGRGYPVKAFATALGIQLTLLLPLSFLMHQKYGFWGLSKSGALNTSWTLMGHKTHLPGIKALIPPPHINSPYTWEDPYASEGVLHTRFESFAMMKSQAGHSAQAALQGVEAFNQLSPFLLVALLAAAFAIAVKRGGPFSAEHKVLLAAAGIMPLGYLLLHFEARYIWLLVPIGMLVGALWLEYVRAIIGRKKALGLASWLFALSFIAYPAYDMKQLFRKGESTYRLAGNLASLNIRGSFTSNDNPSRAGLLAYWLGCNYFAPASDVVKPEEVMEDISRYGIMFYFHHQNGMDITVPLMVDRQGTTYQRVDGNRIAGMQVFLMIP